MGKKGKEIIRRINDGYYIEFYKDEKKEWRWRVRHNNGQIVAISTQGYSRHKDALAPVDGLWPQQYDAEPSEADSEPFQGVSLTAEDYERMASEPRGFA